MNYTRYLIIGAVLVVCAGARTGGQQPRERGIELGMDAALTENWATQRGRSESSTQFDAPLQVLRLGIGVSSTIALEPAVGFRASHANDGTSSQTTFDLGLPIDFAQISNGGEWFVRPFGGVLYQAAHSFSFHQGSAGAGVGVRVPVVAHVMTRFELRYRRWLPQGAVGGFNQLSFLSGFSLVGR